MHAIHRSLRLLSGCPPFVYLALLFATSVVQAQDASGALEGRLTDTSGAVIANAAVELRSIDTNATRSQDI